MTICQKVILTSFYTLSLTLNLFADSNQTQNKNDIFTMSENDFIKKALSNNKESIETLKSQLENNTNRTSNIDKEIEQNLSNKINNIVQTKLYPTFFLFATGKMDTESVQEFHRFDNILADKTQTQYQFVVAFKNFNIKMYEKFRPIYNHESGVKFKPYPMLFDSLKITRVPALALAQCPRPINIKDCQFDYVLRDTNSLELFVKKISDDNKSYNQLERIIYENH